MLYQKNKNKSKSQNCDTSQNKIFVYCYTPKWHLSFMLVFVWGVGK